MNFILLFVLGLMQGASFLFIKISSDYFSAPSIVFFRVLIAFLIIAIFVFYYYPDHKKSWNKNKKKFILLSFTSTVIPFSLLAWAIRFIPSGVEAIYMALIPSFVFIFEKLFGNTKTLNINIIVGLFFGFTGILLLSFQEIIHQNKENIYGHIACLTAAISYGYSVYKTKSIIESNPTVSNFYILALSSILTFPMMMWSQNFLIPPSAYSIFSIISLAIVSTAGALLLMFYLINTVGSLLTSTTNYMVPIIGLVLGAVFLNETISLLVIPSTIMVLLGLFLIRKE